MSISSISSYGGNYASGVHNRRRQEMDAIASAVQSGDIKAAQSALQTLKSDSESGAGATTTGVDAAANARRFLSSIEFQGASQSGTTSSTENPRDQIDALFSAIESGDLSAAQSALESIQANMPKPPMAGLPGSSSDASDLTKSLDALFSAVQSGDTTTAQSALEQIEKLGLSSEQDGTQFDKDLQSLFAAVKSGDMKTAQSSLDTLTEDLQSMGPPPGPPPGMTPMGGPPGMGPHSSNSADESDAMQFMLNDLLSVFAAIESGDITGAQSLLSSLKNGVVSQNAASSAATASYLDQTTT